MSSDNYSETRPWGKFENLLEEDYTKVKRITVIPGGELSYQYHHKRSEVWTIVSGEGIVRLDDNEINVKYQDVVKIYVGQKHNIRNDSNDDLIFIEVQLGDYFGEDDIIRLEDKYNR